MKTATMEKVTFKKWDMADHINTKEDVEGILEAALEDFDAAHLIAVIDDIARSKAKDYIAKDIYNERESLEHSLSLDGNPSFISVVKVLDNLGFQLSVKQKASA